MKPADILALLPVKPEDIPRTATTENKQSRASIKTFQESIQYKAMSITTCDHNLGFLGMVLRASDFDPLNNGNTFAPPKDPYPLLSIPTANLLKSLKLYVSAKTTKKNSPPTVNFALF